MFARRAAITTSAAVAIAIAGCGGSGGKPVSAPASAGAGAAAPSNGASAGGRLTLSADASGQLRFDKKTLQAKAGAVSIVMSNPSPLSHNVSITGNGINQMGETVATGGTSTVSANLKPGIYTFYCSVPGHREAGMFGTLTVR